MEGYAIEERLSITGENPFNGGFAMIGQRDTEEQATATAEAYYEYKASQGFGNILIRVRNIETGELVWDSLDLEISRRSVRDL
jgi:hypothetical protein